MNIMCPINQLSYGLWSWNILKELHSRGKDVAWWPVGPVQAQPEQETILRQFFNNQPKFNYHAPSLRIFHPHLLAERIGQGKSVGWTIFELDKFRSEELNSMQSVDLLLTCSKWGEVILRNELPNQNIGYIPLGVDRIIFNERVEQAKLPQLTPTKTTFLHIGKIEERKLHSQLHEIFYKAFENEKNVQLLVSWTTPFVDKEETQQWERMYKDVLGDKVQFLPWIQTQENLASVMQTSDCGLFPSKAEGWGLPILEMLSVGKWVITTDYSGQTEFCNKDNSYLVKIDKLEPAIDGKWFTSGIGNWAHYGDNQEEQLISYLRQIHSMKQNKTLLVNNNGIKTAEQFTWQNSTTKLLDILGT